MSPEFNEGEICHWEKVFRHGCSLDQVYIWRLVEKSAPTHSQAGCRCSQQHGGNPINSETIYVKTKER
jgi:hypothetical protein